MLSNLRMFVISHVRSSNDAVLISCNGFSCRYGARTFAAAIRCKLEQIMLVTVCCVQHRSTQVVPFACS